jgi:uncharacterized membrane protein
MNYSRVNLLKKSEQRYQGAVSHRFILVAAVVAPLVFIIIFSGVKFVQYTSVKSALQEGKEVWSGLESQYKFHQKELQSLSACRTSLDLLTGWMASQISLSLLLTEIQEQVPPTIQLQHLSIRSEPKNITYTRAEDFVLNYKLMLQGVSQGNRAEDAVMGLRKDLMATDTLGKTFRSVKLASMRKRVGEGGQSARDFRIEGFSKEGEGQ